MASIIDLLMGNVGTENDYLSQNPFYTSGVNIAKTPLPAPQDNAQAFFMPVLQGLLSGGLAGYGKSQARDSQYQAYSASPLMQALTGSQNVGPVADGNAYGNDMIHSYGHTNDAGDIVAPTGWTPKIGQGDLVMGAQAIQSQLEAASEFQKTKNDTLKTLLAKDVENGVITTADAMKAFKPDGTIDASILGGTTQPGGSKKIREEEDAARKEINALPAVQQYQVASSAISRIEKLASIDTGSSDIPFATLLIGGLDGSVVKEGEYNRVSGANPFFEKFKNQIEGALNGTSKLGVDVKKQMLEEFKASTADLYSEAQKQASVRLGIAEGRGANRANAFPLSKNNSLANTETATAAPIPTGELTRSGKRVYIVNGVKGVID